MNSIKTIKPMNDNILVKYEELTEMVGSVYVPINQQKEDCNKVIVLAVGNKVTNISVGQKVIKKSYSGNDINIGNKKYSLVKEKDILGIIE